MQHLAVREAVSGELRCGKSCIFAGDFDPYEIPVRMIRGCRLHEKAFSRSNLKFGGTFRISKQVQHVPVVWHVGQFEMIFAEVDIFIDAW